MTNNPEVFVVPLRVEKPDTLNVCGSGWGSVRFVQDTEVVRLTDHEAVLAADKARIAELEVENEAIEGMLNDAVVDVQALCPDCRNSWLFRHCQDKPYMHEYKQQLEAQKWLLKQCQELLKQEKVSYVELDCYLEGTMPVEDLVLLYKSEEKQ